MIYRNERLYPKWHNSRYYGLKNLRKALEEILNNYDFNNKILIDMGCGSMPYKIMFEPIVEKYIGADISENKSAEIDIDAKTGHVDIENGIADWVISTQVLEHVEAPDKYLREAYRITKKNGMILISTHGFWLYHPDPQDYWRWTASGLNKLLKDNGWQVDHTIGIFGFAAAAMALLQDAVSINLPSFLRAPFCILTQQIVNVFDACYSPEGRKENAALYVMVAKRL